jgi:hypothetical protein
LNVYRRPVESNLIQSVGYDLPSSILELEFVDGKGLYEYYDVPLSVYSRLMNAESLGAYFNEHIRDLYVCEKIG